MFMEATLPVSVNLSLLQCPRWHYRHSVLLVSILYAIVGNCYIVVLHDSDL